MRWLVVVVLLSSSRIGHTDAKDDTTKLVTAALEAIRYSDDKAFGALLAKDAMVVMPDGQLATKDLRRNVVPDGNIMNSFNAGKLTVVEVAPDQAWFHGDALAHYSHGDGPHSRRPQSESLDVRISGIAVKDGSWKLAAIMFAWVGPDKLLYERAKKDGVALGAKPQLTGDLPTAVAAWFPSSLAKAQGAGTVVASGTVLKELGVGDAAGKLAKAWDRLGMVVTSITARKVGKLGFAMVEVAIPVKTEKLAVPLVLGVIATADGDGKWRWQSLSFSTRNYLLRE